MKVNLGCGCTPTEGYLNYDNSVSILLARIPIIPELLHKSSLINNEQLLFIKYSRDNNIKYADVTKHIPLPDNSVDVIYSSHMLEHLTSKDVEIFFKEA